MYRPPSFTSFYERLALILGAIGPSIKRNNRISQIFCLVVYFTGEAQYNAITGIMTYSDIEILNYTLISSQGRTEHYSKFRQALAADKTRETRVAARWRRML